MVAQKVNPQTNRFIIDGISSHGNSGSPVFNCENGNLLGIISGFNNDYIESFDENGRKGDLVLRLPYNSGLTICISAEKILSLIP